MESGTESRGYLLCTSYLLLGLVLIWAIFLPGIFAGQSSLAGLLEHDVGFQWIPFKAYNRWAFSLGQFPLWCPYVFAGMPFLAFSHTQVLYPLGWFLTFFDYPKAANFYYPVHLSIGFTGLYFLMRELGISRFGSFLAGLATIVSCMFFYFINFLPIASSNFWAIWFFYFLVKFSCRARLFPLLGISASLFLEIVGGNIEAVSYQLFFTPFFLLIVLGPRRKIISPVWILLAIFILLGTLLALVQLLPLGEYSKFFIRSAGFTLPGFQAKTLPAGILAALILPLANVSIPGTSPSTPVFYLGLILVFFALYAAFSERKNLWLFLLSALVLVFSFGSIQPLSRLILHIPVLNRFGAHEHSLFLFQIFCAILAGFGIDRALRRQPEALIWFFACSALAVILGRLLTQTIGLRNALAAYSGMALTAFLVLRFSRRPQLVPQIAPALLFIFLLIDSYWFAFSTLPRNSPELYKLPFELQQFKKSAGQSGARCVVISHRGVNDQLLPFHLGLRTLCGTIDGWITVPPLNYAQFLNLIEPRSVEFKNGKINYFGFNVHFRDGKFIQAENFPLMDLLSLRYFLVNYKTIKLASPYSLANDSWSRLLSSGEADAEITANLMRMAGNEARLYQIYIAGEDLFKTGIEQAGINSPVFVSLVFEDQSGKHLAYSRAMGRQAPAEISYALKALAGRSGQLKLATTQVLDQSQGMVLLDPRIENPSRPLQRLFKGEIEIYQNREAFPEAFIVHDCRTIQAPEKILAELKKLSRWDLEKQIILGEDSGSARAVRATAENLKAQGIDFHQLQEPVQKTIDRPDYIAFKAYCLKPGFLFLNHQYLPGWRVYVDGREWRIEKADFCFRAVFVDQGIHTVEFRYQPLGFEIGLYGSIATAFSFVLLAGIMTAKRRKRGRKNSRPAG